MMTRHRIAVLGVVATAMPIPGFAQSWTVQPSAEISADYNDNIRLNRGSGQQLTGDKEASGIVLRGGVRLARRSPTGRVLLEPVIRSSQYGSGNDASSNDFFLNSVFERRNERSNWSLAARFEDEEVLSAELNDPDFNDPDIIDPVTDDSGLAALENRRRRVIVSPAANFELSQTMQLTLSAGYVDSSYDRADQFLTDYTDTHAEATLSYKLDQRNTLSAEISAGAYDPSTDIGEADTYGLALGYRRRLTERDTAFVSAGLERIDQQTQVGGASNTENATVFAAGVTRRFTRARLVLDARRSVDASGLANLLQRDQLRARLSYELSELSTLDVSARVQQSESVVTEAPVADRDFARLEFKLTRQLSRAWSIFGGYSYTRQKFSDQPDDETANAVYVGVRYVRPVAD